MNFFKSILLVFISALPLTAQVTGFSIVKPTGTPNALLTLPGSVRRIELNCAAGCSTTQTATWSIASTVGGASATLVPSASGHFVDVTIGSGAGVCPVVSASGAYTVQATASVTVKATAANSPSATDTLTFDVCNPAVEAYTIPFYRVLYSGQSEDIQGVVWGSANTDGTWSIQSQPAGGDAKISDTNYHDTVFSATVRGLYKVKWTSAADPTASSYSTFFVTGNALPRNVQPNGTQPIDCTVDPNAGGPVIEVGPSQTYKNLEAITPTAVLPGTTIRLHNEDLSGSNPTAYHEWIQITNAGQHDQPIRLCGVPDAAGHLPIMDGTNATARSDIQSNAYVPGLAGILVYNNNFSLYPTYTGPQFVIVEGIAFRNYLNTNSYYPAGTTSGATSKYNVGSSGFRFQKCKDCELNGAEVSNSGNGVFAEGNDNSGWIGVSQRLLFEGNNVHDNGVTGDMHEHNWYLQAWFQVVQFNQMPTYNKTAQGSQYKDRGMTWFRYNLVGTGAQRQLDLVEDQDAPMYLSPALYLTTFRPSNPTDAYTGDELAAAQEAWHHAATVYGNIFLESQVGAVHFAADNIGGYAGRVGALEFYNNSINASYRGSNYYYAWFDTGDGGSNYTHYEWPSINVSNIAMTGWVDTTNPYFQWNTQRDTFMNFGKVLLPAQWGTNNQTCAGTSAAACVGSGWPAISNADAFFNGNAFNGTGVGNFVAGATGNLLDTTTYQLSGYVAGNPLTGAQAKLPVRFQYLAGQGYAVPRNTMVTGTNGGEIGGTDVAAGSLATAATINVGGTTPVTPPAAATVSIALNHTSIVSLFFSSVTALTCTANQSDGTTRACITPAYTSSNLLSAIISGNNLIATLLTGTGNVSVAAEGFAASAPFSVKAAATVKTVSIAISPATIALAASSQTAVACTATESDGTTRACITPVYASSNVASATVSGSTVASTAVAGTGAITVSAEGFTSAAPFTVTAKVTPAVKTLSVAINAASISMATNSSVALGCTATESDGTTRACITPAYTSSNPKSATVSGSTVSSTAVAGTGIITVVAEGFTDTAPFTVVAPTATVKVVSVALNVASIVLNPNSSARVTCTATLSNGTTRPCASFAMVSSNVALAWVSYDQVLSNGLSGSGTIAVSAEGFSLSVPFTVGNVSAKATATSIAMSLSSITLNPNGSVRLTCTATLPGGAKRPCISFTMTSSNVASAHISYDQVIAAAKGKGTITVSAEGLTLAIPFVVQ